MTRVRNPRVVLLEDLGNVIKTLAHIGARWKSQSSRTVYIALADRQPDDNVWRRARRKDEYPEANPANWQIMAAYCDWAVTQLLDLAERARAEGKRREEEGKG